MGLAKIGLLYPHTFFRILGILTFGSVYLAQKLVAIQGALRHAG